MECREAKRTANEVPITFVTECDKAKIKRSERDHRMVSQLKSNEGWRCKLMMERNNGRGQLRAKRSNGVNVKQTKLTERITA